MDSLLFATKTYLHPPRLKPRADPFDFTLFRPHSVHGRRRIHRRLGSFAKDIDPVVRR